MLRTLFTAIFCMFTALAAQAQDQSRAILVLDASGSMWGQIDGVAKITIAQQVIGDLLNTLPQEQLLGLTAYGHRRKGDCSDIETLHLPGVDRALIAATVNGISPRGKTPLSAAVIQAAEALKYTEEVATVILISDGIETCSLDPCEVGRRLEQTGVNFTTHVIGFDVSDQETQAQLQCLAEETGGTYLPASNADELSEALLEVAEVVPMPVPITFHASDGEGGPVITDGLIWTLMTDAAGMLHDHEAVGQLQDDLMPGAGHVEVLRLKDETSVELMFNVTNQAQIFTLVLPKFTQSATLDAPGSVPAGSDITVSWTGPNAERDYIALSEIGSASSKYLIYTYTKEGTPLPLELPIEPGEYELRYVEAQGDTVLARQNITLTPLSATLTAPASAAAGSKLVVEWSGPAYDRDHITIAEIGAPANKYETYTYTRKGSPLSLQMPSAPGEYELRYVVEGHGRMILARQPLSVTAVSASLEAPDSAAAGSQLVVQWIGPDEDRDHITIAEIGARASKYEAYTYTREGSPLSLQMPSAPGAYELRYIMQGTERDILVRRNITITAVNASLDAPASAVAGGQLIVTWQGPGGDRDHLSIAEPGAGANKYESYTYTRDGNPLRLTLPSNPGEYELRYIAQGTDRDIIARQPLTVEAASASLDAPASAPAGGTLLVTWQGPDNAKDYLSIAQLDDRANQYESYVYTRDGSPLQMRLPTSPGTYELRYILQGTDRDILVRQQLVVEPVSAKVEANASVAPGANLVVSWSGPDYRSDYIAISRVGDSGYEKFTYTRDGNPLIVKAPDLPGEYEVRYVMSQDRVVLASIPLRIQ